MSPLAMASAQLRCAVAVQCRPGLVRCRERRSRRDPPDRTRMWDGLHLTGSRCVQDGITSPVHYRRPAARTLRWCHSHRSQWLSIRILVAIRSSVGEWLGVLGFVEWDERRAEPCGIRKGLPFCDRQIKLTESPVHPRFSLAISVGGPLSPNTHQSPTSPDPAQRRDGDSGLPFPVFLRKIRSGRWGVGLPLVSVTPRKTRTQDALSSFSLNRLPPTLPRGYNQAPRLHKPSDLPHLPLSIVWRNHRHQLPKLLRFVLIFDLCPW
ncbi:hypothetical protein B0T14DRAFT_278478 [Immersiella caudata]|uniref:Uncharacterized protein n=1 Tax=Immersiella caudata TaxID=314043 RepID=A0AA39WDJ1_9PEZI|nr:hypothetical protein B0T14DRAFT_278478 [Immersiella caudata]